MIAILISLVALSAFLFGNIAGIDGVLNITLTWYWFVVFISWVLIFIPITDENIDKLKNRVSRGRVLTYTGRLITFITILAFAYFGHFILVGFYIWALMLRISFNDKLKEQMAKKGNQN